MKKLKILREILKFKYSCIIGLIYGVIVSLLGIPITVVTISLFFLTFFLIYFPISIYLVLLLTKEVQRAENELDNKCDPYEFIEIIENLAITFKNSKAFNQSLLLNKIDGLVAIGNIDDALAILEKTNVNRLNCNFKALYYNNIISCYIEKLELQKAEENLGKLLELINKKVISKKFIEDFKTGYNLNLIYINMYNCNFDNCIEQLEEIFSETEKNKIKVNCNFCIGYCYYMNNEKVRSKEYFEYVIANGNRLYDVKKAQEYIEKIN